MIRRVRRAVGADMIIVSAECDVLSFEYGVAPGNHGDNISRHSVREFGELLPVFAVRGHDDIEMRDGADSEIPG